MERLSVSMEGNSIVRINKLASGGPVHIAGTMNKSKRFNLSDGVWGEVFEDPIRSGGAATIQPPQVGGDHSSRGE